MFRWLLRKELRGDSIISVDTEFTENRDGSRTGVSEHEPGTKLFKE